MAQSERFDDVRLYRRRLLVHGIGAECGTDYGAHRAGAFGLSHKLRDGLGDVMRVRGVGRLEGFHEMLEHRARNLADRSVCLCPVSVLRLLNGRIHGRREGARLDQHHVDAKLRDLVAKAVGERLDGKLAGAVDAEERRIEAKPWPALATRCSHYEVLARARRIDVLINNAGIAA
jgi:hypothetical protein